jgi:hypothetical protein
MTQLSVPIDANLVAQIILRSRGRHDVGVVVNNVLSDFLERTLGDADIWSAEHAEEAADPGLREWLQEYGDPSKGYRWQHLLLPNGTQLRARPYGHAKIAEVKRQQVVFEGTSMSPSQFASVAWNRTSRSAPRDLEVKRPGDTEWQSARQLLER